MTSAKFPLGMARRMSNMDIKLLPTSDAVLSVIASPAKVQLAPGWEVSHAAGRGGGNQALKQRMAITTPWQYLHGMQSWSMTLGVAGCFTISQPKEGGGKEDVYMVELQDLLDHCASAGAFVSTNRRSGSAGKRQYLRW